MGNSGDFFGGANVAIGGTLDRPPGEYPLDDYAHNLGGARCVVQGENETYREMFPNHRRLVIASRISRSEAKLLVSKLENAFDAARSYWASISNEQAASAQNALRNLGNL